MHMPHRPHPPRSVWLVLPALLLTALIGLYMALEVPLYAKPLEVYHVDVVDAMKISRTLPPILPGQLVQEFHQPPLYYTLMAVLTLADPPVANRSAHLQYNPYYLATRIGNRNLSLPDPTGSATVYAGRLVNLALLLLSVALTYHLALTVARHLSGRHAIAVAATWLMATQPELLFIGTTFSNDMPAVFMLTLALWWLARMTRREGSGFTLRNAAILGLIIALGALCKVHVLIALLPAGLVWLWYNRRWQTAVALAAGVVLLTGSWLAFNQAVYGDASGYKRLLQGVPRNDISNDTWSPDVLAALWKSFWIDFSPGMTGFAPDAYYIVVTVLVVVALLAVLVLALRRQWQPVRVVVLSYAALVIILPMIILWQKGNLYWGIPSPPVGEGRHFLIILSALVVLVSLALRAVPRLGRAVLWVVPLLSLAFIMWAAFDRLPANYGISQALLLALDTPYTFRNGMVVTGLRTTPGDDGWWVDVQWLANGPQAKNWSVSAQFIQQKDDGNLSSVSQEDSYPGNGLHPTAFWRPGEVIRDRYWIAAKGLQQGKLGLFVYDLQSGERVPLADGNLLIIDIKR